jgi:hypothetical protein
LYPPIALFAQQLLEKAQPRPWNPISSSLFCVSSLV